MVQLIWKNKVNITDKIQNLKYFYKDKYEIFKIQPEFKEIFKFDQKKDKAWRNKLIWGDNLEVLFHLLNFFKAKINLIYIDPPFFTGTNYHIDIVENDNNYNTIAYYDHWNKDLDSYLQMLYERIILLRELLAKNGLLFVHLDWHASHYIKLILDEVFGEKRFVNNIVWYYYNKYSAGKKNLPRAHDDILVYSKTNDYTFNEIRIQRKTPTKQLKREMVNGVLKNVKDENGHVIYRLVTDKKLDDVWRIPCLQPASKEWTGFPTQKHHDLLNKIIQLGSNEQDLIADFFCGTGTTLLEAEKLNRKWIGCDISEYSIYLTKKRILNYIKTNSMNKKIFYPFEMLTNLNEEHNKILNSGFFEKKLKIKRKK